MHLPVNVRMAINQLVAQSVHYVGIVERSGLLAQLGVENHVQQQVARLFLDTVEILVQDGVGQLVRLLDRVVSECFEGLFAIPGTLFAQRIHNFQQAGRRLQFVLFHRIVSVF